MRHLHDIVDVIILLFPTLNSFTEALEKSFDSFDSWKENLAV